MSVEEDHNERDARQINNADPLSKIGTTLAGKYRIDQYIEGGGFGEVYRGHNIVLEEQRVVVKFLKRTEFRDRFVNEAKTLCQLDHPNICRIYDFIPDENALVMQFIDGQTCESIAQGADHPGGDVVLRVAQGVSAALAYAHSMIIAHRDITPRNIMVDRNGNVYLIDFGIAKAIGSPTLTGTGRPPYTPGIAAPERHSHTRKYDPFLSDIYELGATLCKFAFGRTPEELAGRWNSLPLSRSMRRVLRKATQPFPEDRYQSAAALREDILKVRQVYRSRGYRMKLLVSGTVVMLGIASVLWMMGEGKKPTPSLVVPKYQVDTLSVSAPEQSQLTNVSTFKQTASDSSLQGRVSNSAGVEGKEISKVTSVKLEEPPPSGKVALRFTIIPESNTRLFLDGEEYSYKTPIMVKPGGHRLRIINAGFPIQTDLLEVSKDLDLKYALDSIFAGAPLHRLIIGTDERLDEASIRLRLNGFEQPFRYTSVDNMPYVTIIGGLWKLEFSIAESAGSLIAVDSFVTFPYTGGRLHHAFRGNAAEVDFGGPEWLGQQDIYITVF